MADFCNQCAMTIGFRGGDLKDLGRGRKLEPEYGWPALCEGCGFGCIVDNDGNCIADNCDKEHGKNG